MTVASLILASGQAKRFGSDKRQALIDKTAPMLHAVFRSFAEAGVPVFAVIRADDVFGLDACKTYGVTVIQNDSPNTGMGDSLSLGIRAITAVPDLAGVIIGLADMPWVAPSTIRAIAGALIECGQPVVPIFQGKPGHPRAIPTQMFPILREAQGDEGARHLVDWSLAKRLEVDDPGILQDVDTQDDLIALLAQNRVGSHPA
jgi:molybdenum cofactor cytidylyltransferase